AATTWRRTTTLPIWPSEGCRRANPRASSLDDAATTDWVSGPVWAADYLDIPTLEAVASCIRRADPLASVPERDHGKARFRLRNPLWARVLGRRAFVYRAVRSEVDVQPLGRPRSLCHWLHRRLTLFRSVRLGGPHLLSPILGLGDSF